MKYLILALLLPFAVHAQKPAAKKAEPKKVEAPTVEEKTTWEKVKDTASEAGEDIKKGSEKVIEGSEREFEKAKESLAPVTESFASAKDFRGARSWVITGNYSYIDLLIPSKIGLTVGYVADAANTVEIDYMRGSLGFGWLGVDIGSLTEQRLALLWRSYNQRNTFNFQMGVNYNHFRVHIGDELLRRVTGNPAVDITVMEFQTLGVSWGMGNRWVTRGGFVWGFDWLQIHVPVATLKEKTPYIDAASNQEDKDDAETASKIIRNFPRIVALKIQLGASF